MVHEIIYWALVFIVCFIFKVPSGPHFIYCISWVPTQLISSMSRNLVFTALRGGHFRDFPWTFFDHDQISLPQRRATLFPIDLLVMFLHILAFSSYYLTCGDCNRLLIDVFSNQFKDWFICISCITNVFQNSATLSFWKSKCAISDLDKKSVLQPEIWFVAHDQTDKWSSKLATGSNFHHFWVLTHNFFRMQPGQIGPSLLGVEN